jgi:hypothetical protein
MAIKRKKEDLKSAKLRAFKAYGKNVVKDYLAGGKSLFPPTHQNITSVNEKIKKRGYRMMKIHSSSSDDDTQSNNE